MTISKVILDISLIQSKQRMSNFYCPYIISDRCFRSYWGSINGLKWAFCVAWPRHRNPRCLTRRRPIVSAQSMAGKAHLKGQILFGTWRNIQVMSWRINMIVTRDFDETADLWLNWTTCFCRKTRKMVLSTHCFCMSVEGKVMELALYRVNGLVNDGLKLLL